ncbi:uncharacterized protein SPSK_09934 [Sporothrix schenckii 1099-18]|uniref:Uncharacterized protein n=1 Tax=Sporothrix schenckii 1099-18 TaxID=1397361 RepID=A0A0F2M8X7_SPOSC|nr:uncharacterized protein SPSK_09934 [Sporothrix schenckii 1099-18]KJR84616.1 hypothetical protein SPSK_09934 [Sporothrix schenckii 1099-18]
MQEKELSPVPASKFRPQSSLPHSAALILTRGLSQQTKTASQSRRSSTVATTPKTAIGLQLPPASCPGPKFVSRQHQPAFDRSFRLERSFHRNPPNPAQQVNSARDERERRQPQNKESESIGCSPPVPDDKERKSPDDQQLPRFRVQPSFPIPHIQHVDRSRSEITRTS